MIPITSQLLIRIFSRIKISTEHFYKGDPCWEWIGSIDKNTGYGGVYVKHPLYAKTRNNYAAHRLTYELFVGDIPEGYEIDHLCKVRHCVNPVHLEAVTRAENNSRSSSPSSLNAKKTVCHNGHPLTEENTFHRINSVHKTPMRQCVICSRLRGKAQAQRWRDARKAKGLPVNPYPKKRLVK